MQSETVGRAFYDFQTQEVTWNGLRTCYMDRLGEIEQQTLLIHGEVDRLVPLSAAKEAAERLPYANLEILPNCGHWPQRDQPAAFNRLVADFLRPN
jgi:pimeloyl-ACP methyl ester carboxylesterase